MKQYGAFLVFVYMFISGGLAQSWHRASVMFWLPLILVFIHRHEHCIFLVVFLDVLLGGLL